MVMCEPDCDSYVANLPEMLLPAFGTSPQENHWPSDWAACARLHKMSTARASPATLVHAGAGHDAARAMPQRARAAQCCILQAVG